MDTSTVMAIGGFVAAVVGVSATVFSMDPARRQEFVSFWKKWLMVVFAVTIAANSMTGIYLFVQGPPQLVRSDILSLALHLFNLLSVPFIWFFVAMGKVMDARNAKRVELIEEVIRLRKRVDAFAPVSGAPAIMQVETQPPS